MLFQEQAKAKKNLSCDGPKMFGLDRVELRKAAAHEANYEWLKYEALPQGAYVRHVSDFSFIANFPSKNMF